MSRRITGLLTLSLALMFDGVVSAWLVFAAVGGAAPRRKMLSMWSCARGAGAPARFHAGGPLAGIIGTMVALPIVAAGGAISGFPRDVRVTPHMG